MSNPDFDLEERVRWWHEAVKGRYPDQLPPPPESDDEEEQPTLSRYEQLRAQEIYEISLLPPPPPHPELDARLAANRARLDAEELARANAPIKINNRSVPMATFAGGDIPFDSRKGQPAPFGINFVPFIALTKWCYTYAPKHLMQPLATAFFDADKIYARDWDLYYVAAEYCGVITFVPEHQLQTLFNDINTAFPEAKVKITNKDYQGGFIIDFEDLRQDLRPRWLGCCASRSHYQAWVGKLSIERLMTLPTGSPPDRSVEAFKAKVDAANAISKAKKKNGKVQTFQHAIMQRQDMVRQGLRAQRYLGLLPKSEMSLMPDISSLTISDPIDVNKPAPHAFDMDAIFIAIDLEAYESPPRMITEIGLATLDTRDLKGLAPGEVGKEWHKAIRGRHIRVDEYKHLTNSQYVQGCPGSFEFGESEFVPKSELGSVLASCFRFPFSQQEHIITGSPTEDRNIVLVGHDLGQDINYCHQLGFSVLNRASIKESMDTVAMYRAYTKDPNARSLGSILYDFDLSGWHLHNAGNDAVYTIQAMIAICVKSASTRGEIKNENVETKLEAKTAVLVEAAKEKAKEDFTGWDEEDDGGVSLPPTDGEFERGGGGRGGRGSRGGGGRRGRGGGDGGRGGRGGGGIGGGGTLYTYGGAVLDV